LTSLIGDNCDMLRRLIRATFDNRLRHDDRSCADGGDRNGVQKPPILRRRTINAIALLAIAVILYGTLLPFQIDPARTLTWKLGFHRPMSGDFVANITLYVPVGAFLCLLFRRRGSSSLSVGLLSVLVAGTLAYLTEVAQTVLVARVASWTDTFCNFLGASIGVVLAPLFQRILRNLHTWLYVALRTQPFAAAAAAATLCIWTYGLAPFDIRPTPQHMTRAIQSLYEAETILPFGTGSGGDTLMSPRQAVEKVAACTSYSLLAFLAVFAAREAGRSVIASGWHGLGRAIAMVSAIELMQLFTISHVTDPADLTGGWICAGLGAMAAWFALQWSPALHRRPRFVLQCVVAMMVAGVLVWKSLALLVMDVGHELTCGSWLPLMSSFHRPWNSVLGDYTTGFLQYAIVGGVLAVLWRSSHRRPPVLVVTGGVLVVAFLTMAYTTAIYRPIDTGQGVVALLAGLTVIGLDRALWEKHTVASSVPPP